ncbi:hypothetical protein E2C01_027583 [Portunus trituberculatus]|uniref:Uncharacterized protein n=1 Tax=Portunus trituberculatus TaxID=210409 RepID=A0A5B7EI89_PORTR|nr:hypothetical protein [Portunus trituberculatus]
MIEQDLLHRPPPIATPPRRSATLSPCGLGGNITQGTTDPPQIYHTHSLAPFQAKITNCTGPNTKTIPGPTNGPPGYKTPLSCLPLSPHQPPHPSLAYQRAGTGTPQPGHGAK